MPHSVPGGGGGGGAGVWSGLSSEFGEFSESG